MVAKACAAEGHSPVAVSSRSRSRASTISASASATRRRSVGGRACTTAVRVAPSPTVSSTWPSRDEFGGTSGPRTAQWYRRAFSTDMEPGLSGDSPTMAALGVADRSRASVPSQRIRPNVGRETPPAQRIRVVLPAPRGPATITISPSETSSETSRSTVIGERAPNEGDRYRLVTERRERAGTMDANLSFVRREVSPFQRRSYQTVAGGSGAGTVDTGMAAERRTSRCCLGIIAA